MTQIESYRDLAAWQTAMDLAVEVYELTRLWPREELYGLTSQARRAANSVAANIAEGYGREKPWLVCSLPADRSRLTQGA